VTAKRKGSKTKRRGGKTATAPEPRSPATRSKSAASPSLEPSSERPVRPPWSRRDLVAIGLAVLSGVLWVMACADIDIWPLAWIAMLPALWAIDRAPTTRRALLFGWITGLVANLGGFYWITGLLTRFADFSLPLAALGTFALAAYQALVFLLFAWAVRGIRASFAARRGAPLPMALVAPLVMVTFELLVPFIFPWYLAITQAWVLPVIQIAELTGPLGVTALLLAVNGAIYDVWREPSRRRKLVPAIGAAAFLASALAFGFLRIHQVEAARQQAPSLAVGVVQGNIGFDEKGLNRQELAASQLRGLQQMSAELEAQGAELLMWSESAYPYRVSRRAAGDFPEDHLARIRRGFDAPLLLGAVTADPAESPYPYNSALLLESDGSFSGRFDKIFLLIFGEYIPLLETFEWVEKLVPDASGHFSRGEEIVTFDFDHEGETYRLGPLICYEDILPSFGRELGSHHPHLLVNLTNDAWFGDTAAPWQHLALSVFRAVEIRSDLVRSVNTGVSAYIDATGRVAASTYVVDPAIDPRGVDGLVREVALLEGGHTFFVRFGDVFGYLCAGATFFLWLAWPRLRRRESAPPT
jgi:apolipoprotein N-acyltransferase